MRCAVPESRHMNTAMDIRRLAINQITTPSWSLEQAIEGYARHGIHGVGVWRDKLAACGLIRARSALRAAGSWVPSLCKAGNIAQFATAGTRPALDDCRRAIEEAAEIGARCVVFVCGGIGTDSKDIEAARAKVAEVLHEASAFAVKHGVSLGIEPFHPMHAAERGCINTLSQAHTLCASIGPATSVVVDVFHVWWDPELYRFLAPPYTDAIATVQLCDWRVPTRHPVEDRAMMGEGAANVHGIAAALEDSGYTGPYEVEIFSQDWWSMPPDDVVRICAERYLSLGTSIIDPSNT